MLVANIRCIKHWPTDFLVVVIRSYQLLISPLLGSHCRFQPTCSQFAIESLKTHGILKGSWLTLKRLGRCQPMHPGGYDPVPNDDDRH